MVTSKRHRTRRVALQLLYAIDMNGGDVEYVTELLDNICQKKHIDEDFCWSIVRGVRDNVKDIDSIISSFSKNWRLDRITVIDKNIIRMGIYELLYRDDIPAAVVIDEAIRLAKEFGDVKSPAFVNGILDAVKGRYSNARK